MLLNDRGAAFSDCDAYRYRLWRTWDARKPPLVFCMLNPSTATAEQDDPTIARCTERALHQIDGPHAHRLLDRGRLWNGVSRGASPH